MFHNLVLSGGSLKGIAYLGCFQTLEELDLVKHLKVVVGSSIGAFMGMMLCSGMKSGEMLQLVKAELSHYLSNYEIDVDNILNIFNTMGVDDGKFFIEVCRKVLQLRFNCEDMTFLEFAKRSGKHLVVCVSNLTKHETEYLSVDTAPNLSVIKAIRMSVSLPIIFTPVTHNHDYYGDAAIFNNFPVDYFKDEHTLQDTLCFEITNPEQTYTDKQPMNLFIYFKMMIDSIYYRINSKAFDATKNNKVISLKFGSGNPYDFDIKTFKFNLTPALFEEYRLMGYNETKQQLTHCTSQ
jgi:NTE family protein